MVLSMVLAGNDNMVSQMRKGASEYCVLAILLNNDAYGLEISRLLAHEMNLVASEGTIYPLLSRLSSRKFVTSYLEASSTGPARRYYRITQAGRVCLSEFTTQWQLFRDAVDAVLDRRA
jgi:PadR family transcriptional regulator PadR